MKKKILTTFKKRVKSILKTELNAKNIMIAIGEYAIPVISYTFGIINWTEDEIKNADLSIRKSLNMYKMFELKSDIDRLYIPRSMGGRGLQSVWDGFKCANVRIAHYINGDNDPHMEVCAEFDRNNLFSIVKRAEKYSTSHKLTTPKILRADPCLGKPRLYHKSLKIPFTKTDMSCLFQNPNMVLCSDK